MLKTPITLVVLAAVSMSPFRGVESAAAEKCFTAKQQNQTEKREADRVVAGDTLEIVADDLRAKPTYRIQAQDRLKIVGRDGEYGFGRVDYSGKIENWQISNATTLTLGQAEAQLKKLDSFAALKLDSLEVVEFGLPISSQYRVSDEGSIWLPGIGGIPVAGCSVADAKKSIAHALSNQFEAPQIEVRLDKPESDSQSSNANPLGTERTRESLTTASIQIIPDPYERPRRPSNLPEIDEEPQRIEFRIAFVEDRENALAEFDDVSSDPNQSCLKSQAILPALRVLEKHGVIKMLSVPRIVCRAGEEVKVETNIAAANDSAEIDTLTFKVYGGRRDGALRLGFSVDSTLNGERQIGWMGTHFSYEPGETLIIKRHFDDSSKAASRDAPPIYVVLTPRVVSGAGKRKRGFDGFGIAN